MLENPIHHSLQSWRYLVGMEEIEQQQNNYFDCAE